MTPLRKIDTQDVGGLIQQLGARRITQSRFSVTMPVNELANGIYAAYKAEVLSRGHRPIIDDPTLAHIKAAAEWLADPHGKCGLMLTGLYGNGKSTLMRAICNLIDHLFYSAISTERKRVKVIDAREISRLGSLEETRPAYSELLAEDLLAIDDLGEEPPETIVYGMTHTPVKDLLLDRYNRQRFTIVTTNLINTAESPQLTEHYGPRLVDRLREMMKIIVFRNPSYRPRP